MSVDTIRVFFTYLTALIIVVGGFAFIYAVRDDQPARDLALTVSGFVGFTLQFLFGQAVQTMTVRHTLAATRTQSMEANDGR